MADGVGNFAYDPCWKCDPKGEHPGHKEGCELDSGHGEPPFKAEVSNSVNHPPHYTSHPSGIECIQVVEHMSFNLGNAIKYIWRADLKGSALEDLEKAAWYVNRELERRRKASPK